MNIVSAFLIRQVSTSATEEFKKDLLGKLKEAATSGNYNNYIQTLYVELVPDGQLNTSGAGGESYIYNPYTSERYKEGWDDNKYYKGASRIIGGRRGMLSCLYKSENSSASNEVFSSYDGTGSLVSLDSNPNAEYHGRPVNGLLWYLRDKTYNQTICHMTTTKCTIPIMNDFNAMLDYVDLVDTYCESKLDSDLEAIADFLDSNLFDYDYYME